MDWKRVLRSYDYPLLLATIALGVFGIVMVYASIHAPGIPASVANAHPGLWGRQRMFIISGTVLMIGFSLIDYHFITRFYLYIYALMMVLLIVVFAIGADDFTGTARWLWIPVPGYGLLSMQPSEFAKVFMIIFLAKFLAVKRDSFNHVLWLMLIFVLIAVPTFFVVIQPSLSASMVVLSISLTVLFVGGLYYRTILIGMLAIAPVAVVAWLDMNRREPLFLLRMLGQFQWDRIQTWLRPEEATPDQIRQIAGSLYAIGSGGATGRGFMENPHIILAHNDFIFSVVAAQFGFWGGIVLLAVVAFIIVRCIFIALRAVDMEGRLIAAGVAGMLIFETFFHVGVATALLPNTGMPFPFLSYGGSMIWVHMIAMGLVLNVKLPRKPKSMFADEDGFD